MRKIIILGGIGNGSVIADAITHANTNYKADISVAGFLNDRIAKNELIESYPVLGTISDFTKFTDYYFVNTIYKIDGQRERINRFESLNIPDDRLLTFIHPQAYVAPSAKISPGVIIMPNVSISSGASVGKCSLIMPGATLGHNSVVNDYCHLAAQCCIGSFVTINRACHIGLNASIRENVTLAEYSVLGMGSVLLSDTQPDEIWVGNPARMIRIADN